MNYAINMAVSAIAELKALRAYDRGRIHDAILKNLEGEPTSPTRNRKRLHASSPRFEHVPPIWELRVGDHRIFHDVDEAEKTVYVRAIRLKQRGRTTKEITDEDRDD